MEDKKLICVCNLIVNNQYYEVLCIMEDKNLVILTFFFGSHFGRKFLVSDEIFKMRPPIG